MLSSKDLSARLRKDIVSSRFTALLRSHGHDYRSLCELHDGVEVAARLDGLRPFDHERDSIVADLLRLRRDAGAPLAFAALMYAVLPATRRAARRVAGYIETFGLPTDESPWTEAFRQCVASTIEVLTAFNPETRNGHVLVGIERDIITTTVRLRKREAAQVAVVSTVAPPRGHNGPACAITDARVLGVLDVVARALFGSGRDPATQHDEYGAAAYIDAETPSDSVFDFMGGRRARGGPALEPDDVALGERAIRIAGAACDLTEQDMYLLIGRTVRGRTSEAMGKEFGVDRRTVVRQTERLLQRTAKEIRIALHALGARSEQGLPVAK